MAGAARTTTKSVSALRSRQRRSWHRARAGQGPVLAILAMLAVLRVAPGCSAPPLTAAAHGADGNVGRDEETALSQTKKPLAAQQTTNSCASGGSASMSKSGSVLVSADTLFKFATKLGFNVCQLTFDVVLLLQQRPKPTP